MIKMLEDFKMNLVEDGKSPKTIQSYIGDIAGILKYLETMGTEFEDNWSELKTVHYENMLSYA